MYASKRRTQGSVSHVSTSFLVDTTATSNTLTSLGGSKEDNILQNCIQKFH